MTITGMTRFVQQNYKVQNSHLTHKLPNGSLPPKEHVNPYCPEGMDITGRTDFRRIVPVDEGVANKIKSLVFESMEKNCGMSDGGYFHRFTQAGLPSGIRPVIWMPSCSGSALLTKKTVTISSIV